jgi:hypothetical protein
MIDIDADKLDTGNVSEPTLIDQPRETGTIVELASLKNTFDWLSVRAVVFITKVFDIK